MYECTSYIHWDIHIFTWQSRPPPTQKPLLSGGTREKVAENVRRYIITAVECMYAWCPWAIQRQWYASRPTIIRSTKKKKAKNSAHSKIAATTTRRANSMAIKISSEQCISLRGRCANIDKIFKLVSELPRKPPQRNIFFFVSLFLCRTTFGLIVWLNGMLVLSRDVIASSDSDRATGIGHPRAL